MIQEKIAPVVVVLLSATVILALSLPDGSLEPDFTTVVADTRELSGLCWDPERRQLVAVTDEGRILELSPAGEILRRRDTDGLDLEAVSLAADGTTLLILDEASPSLHAADPMTFELRTTVRIPSDDPANVRFEGVIGTDDHLLLAREGGGLFRWSPATPSAAPELVAATDAPLNDITASPDGEELLLLSRCRGLRLVSRRGEPLGPWKRLRLRRAEGLAWVPGRGLLVVTDENPSRLASFTHFHTWADLREALTTR
jgi:uncharacterized protein YjiK